jgi:UDP-N-acetylglucosamine--N-acetylmuramyl-(pentapeptide) pyrophosphoryl-undecaprenol N-acetylglucosamine transferase
LSAPFVVAAGGTGGHLFPARALAGELARRGHGVALAADARAAAYAAEDIGVPCHIVRSATPSGRGAFGTLAAGATIASGTLQARRLLRRLGARVVIGFGGYPSLPTLLAARGVGARVVLHEQNAVLGRVNRLMLRRAEVLALSFEETSGFAPRPGLSVVTTGNPVRPEVLAERDRPFAPPQDDAPLRLLVFGGSQGARLFGQVVPAALGRLAETLRRRLRVVQQVRPEDESRVAGVYRELGIEAEVRTFYDELPQRIARAHLVIARAGAGSVSELAVIGRPALLVPYAHAMDDHQVANARALTTGGGAVLLVEERFTPDELAARIDSLARRPDVLERMAARARAVGRPEAVSALADLVEPLANGGRAGGYGVAREPRRAAA